MGFEEGKIILENPTGFYYSGQFVKGRVIFELTKTKKVRGIYLKAKGFCKVHWTSQHSRRENDRTVHYTKDHNSYEEYIDLKTYLVGSSNAELHLNPGKYDYPFSFQLPANCPSSYENKHAHVRYQILVVADRPFKIDQEIGHDLRVATQVDLNTLNCNQPVDFEFDQTYCCWCMNSGSSETLVKMPASGYCPGQVIPLEVSCKNSGSVEIEHIRFTIKKETRTRAMHEPDSKHKEETVLEVRKGPVSGNTDRKWTVEMQVPDGDYPNMDGCSFIDINYTFTVSVEPEGCHSDSDDSCKIFFGTIPLRGFQDVGPNQQAPVNEVYPTANNPYPQPVVHQPLAQNPYPAASSPYPNPYPGAGAPYPAPNTAPYPAPNTAPYPTPNTAPYPTPNTAPYPGTNSPHPNGAQYPNPSPYPGPNPPYPNSTSPYPNPSPYSPQPVSPYPPRQPSPLPVAGTEPATAMPMPSLPPGTVPYPIHTSPYAMASAPEPATPDESKKLLTDDANNSPFNPDFVKN